MNLFEGGYMSDEMKNAMRLDDIKFVKSVIFEQTKVEKNPNSSCGEFTGFIYCPECGDDRRTESQRIYPTRLKYIRNSPIRSNAYSQLSPFPHSFYIIHSRCLQCSSEFIILLTRENNSYSLLNIPVSFVGIISSSCPATVIYYIDQAYRSKAMGATSAAVVMYRSSLENLLYEQGFESGQLFDKIKKLQKQIDDGDAPKWTLLFDANMMNIIRELGNYAVHPNNGDISKQREMDNNLLVKVEFMLKRLMEYVYVIPAKEKEAMEDMNRTLKSLKGQDKSTI